jgi:hypothetical protein
MSRGAGRLLGSARSSWGCRLHLAPLRTAATADIAEVLATLLPCMWGYSELGRSMAAKGLPADPRYGRWIPDLRRP